MPVTLCNFSHQSFWADKTWEEISLLKDKEIYLIIVPMVPLYNAGVGLPLDMGENMSLSIIQQSLEQYGESMKAFVLPPVRYAASISTPGCVSMDFNTAYDSLIDIASCIKRSGFKKLLLFAGTPSCDAFVDIIALDIRQKLEMQTFQVSLKALSFELNPSSAKQIPEAVNAFILILQEIDQYPPLPHQGALYLKSAL